MKKKKSLWFWSNPKIPSLWHLSRSFNGNLIFNCNRLLKKKKYRYIRHKEVFKIHLGVHLKCLMRHKETLIVKWQPNNRLRFIIFLRLSFSKSNPRVQIQKHSFAFIFGKVVLKMVIRLSNSWTHVMAQAHPKTFQGILIGPPLSRWASLRWPTSKTNVSPSRSKPSKTFSQRE